MTALDKTGAAIKVGDRITFAARAGNGHELRLGVVDQLFPHNPAYAHQKRPHVRLTTDRNAIATRQADEVVVLPPAPAERPEPREWR